MKYLNPKTNLAFKKLFGDVHHKSLTINFLNTMLNLTDDKLIKDVSFLETESFPNSPDGKKNYLDVYCIDTQNNDYIVAMQSLHEFNFLERSQHYAARALVSQAPDGCEYQKLLPITFLGIINYQRLDDGDEIVAQYNLTHAITGKNIEKSLINFCYVILQKFHKNIDELTTQFDAWLYFLKHAESLEAIPEPLQNLQQAFQLIDKLQWNQADLQIYMHEEEAIERESRQQHDIFEEGQAKGREVGAQKKAEEIALHAFNLGLSLDDIEQLTDLSVEQLEELRQKVQK